MSIDPHEWARRAFDRHDIRYEKQVDAAITTGSQAIRAALLLNGAGSIALLTLVGSGNAPGDAGSWFISTIVFATGALFAVLSMGCAYFTNYLFAASLAHQDKEWSHPYIKDNQKSKRRSFWAAFFQVISISLGLASLCAFIIALILVFDRSSV